MESVAVILSFVFSITALVFTYISMKKSKEYKKLYDNSLAKFNNTANVKDKFCELFTRLNEVEEKCNSTVCEFEKVSGNIHSNKQKYGLVKYNAYGENNNKLSFALAILNGNDSGVLITSIFTTQGSNIYCKQVINGISDVRLSEEESRAIEIAIKTPMHEEVIANEMKKVNVSTGVKIKNKIENVKKKTRLNF